MLHHSKEVDCPQNSQEYQAKHIYYTKQKTLFIESIKTVEKLP